MEMVGRIPLTSFSGLNSLIFIEWELNIFYNDALTSLSGLDSLKSLYSLSIYSNNSLTNLSGLDNLTSVRESLVIEYNASLNSFCGIYPLLRANGLTGAYIVNNNAINPPQLYIINEGPCNATSSQYLFEESGGTTVIDSKGSNDGTIINNAVRVNGVRGGGLEFTGSGYINLGNAFSENVQNEVTLSAWIKPLPTGGYQGIIMHGGPNVDTYALYIRPDSKEIAFKTSGTTNSLINVKNVNELWDGKWHHLAVTYNGLQKIIYLDNTPILTMEATGIIESGIGYNLLIGAGRDEEFTTLLYKGVIDEVMIYNYALTSEQVNNLFNILPKPENFTGINKVWSENSYKVINLSWTPPDSETLPTGYNVYSVVTENGTNNSVSTTKTNYDFQIPSIENDSWWFYVMAVYETGESSPTAMINVISDIPVLTVDGAKTNDYLAGSQDCWSCWYVASYWYKFYAPPLPSGENKAYEILADGGLDLSMQLYEDDRTTIIESDSHYNPYRDAQIRFTNTTGKWYYIKLTATTAGTYNIGVKTIQDLPYKNIFVDWPYSEGYDTSQNIVEYRFKTGIAGIYTIQTNGTLNTELGLYDVNGFIEQDDDDGEGLNALIQRNLAANTDYIVRFNASSNGKYSIVVNAPIMELVVNAPCVSSSVIYAPEVDWYKFQTETAGTYIVDQSVTSLLHVSLYESDKATLIAKNEIWQQHIEQELSANTMYFIKINSAYDWRPPDVVNTPYCIGVSHLVDMSPTYSEYLFEESGGTIVIDSHESNDGSIINNGVRAIGVRGGGLEFTGSGYINLGHVFGENVQNEVTLSAWIKPIPTGGYQGIIMHGGPNVDTYALYIRPDSKEIAFKTSGTTNSWINIKNVNDLWNGYWHHLTVTFEGIQKIIYLDSVAILNVDATGNIESGLTYNLVIGAGRDEESPKLLYKGLIDEVRIYNYALTSEQIGDLFNIVNPTPEIMVSPTSITLDYNSGASGTFNITSNTSWSVTDDADWLNASALSGSNDEIIKVSAILTNTGTIPRIATITIAGTGVTSKTVTVTQKTNESICPQHFHTVWEGTLGQDHMNINIIGAKLDEFELEPGDEIGVFDGDLCVGYGKLTKTIDQQNILNIKVSRDDGLGNGFTAGHDVKYTIWDCSAGLEYDVRDIQCFNTEFNSVTCLPFESGGTAFVELSAFSEICQTLRFNAGWNIFSIPGISGTPIMETIFQPMMESNSLVKIQDEAGNSLENLGIYGGWKSSIEEIAPSEGYKIKVNNNPSLEVCYAPVSFPYAITLQTGWNIMGFPQTTSIDAQDILQQLIDRSTLTKVQDEAGNSMEDLGIFGGWKNNIGNFLPGKGFKIKVNAPETLLIYESYPKSSVIPPELVATTHFAPEFVGNGIDHMNINLVNLPINALQIGDELAVYDGATCVGAVTVMPHHLQYQSVSIVASATDYQGMAGFGEGNPIILKLWDSQNNKEFVLEPEYVKGTSSFIKHETTFASLEKYEVTGLSEIPDLNIAQINCYPNPFSDEVTVEINLAKESEVSLEVLNQLGQREKYISTKTFLNSGLHKLNWDGRNENNATVSPGIYHLRVTVGESVAHRKIVFSGAN